MARSPARKHAPPAPVAEEAAVGRAAVRTDPVSALGREQIDATLAQAQAALRSLDELLRLQLQTNQLALQRLEELQQRLQHAASGAEFAGLQAELLRFEGAAALRFWQQLFDIGLRDVAARTAQFAHTVSRAGAGLPLPDYSALLGLIHTGIGPLDDLFGAAVNRELVPPDR